jgi:hypothetical protein
MLLCALAGLLPGQGWRRDVSSPLHAHSELGPSWPELAAKGEFPVTMPYETASFRMPCGDNLILRDEYACQQVPRPWARPS